MPILLQIQEIGLLEFLILLPQGGTVFWIKIIFILIDIFLFGTVVWLLFTTTWFKEHYGQDLGDFFLGTKAKKGRQERKWRNIEKRAQSENEAERKLAVIEAEEFLDNFLQRRKFPGENLRERFNFLIKEQILPQGFHGDLSQASQMVDDIIHDPDFKLSKEKAAQTLANFAQVLKNLTDI